MKFTILKLTAFAMLATASSVYASEEDHAVQSLLRGSTSASSDEDSADEELYGWRDWSTRANGTPWSVRSNGTPWSVQPNGQPWWNNNNGNGWWNGNNRSNNLQTCRANCQCPGGGCQMNQCTSNCQCAGGGCQMNKCGSNCQCAGGNCQMNSCQSNCHCPGGNCQGGNTGGSWSPSMRIGGGGGGGGGGGNCCGVSLGGSCPAGYKSLNGSNGISIGSINGMQMCCRNLNNIVFSGPSKCAANDIEGDSEDFDLESEDWYDFEEGGHDDEDEDEDWDADVVSTQA